MEDPLNNLRGNFGGGGWRPRPPAPRPSPQTRIPSPWVSTGIPTPFPMAPWIQTSIPTPFPVVSTGIPTPFPARYTGVPTPFPSPGTPSPSDVPSVSLSPSESLSPTVECGPPIDDYTKMGKGRCLDSRGQQYPLVRFERIVSPAACELKCGCVANTLTLQGFDYKFDTGTCRCLVNEDTGLQGICGANGFNPNNSGFGQITSIQPDNTVCCFRNDLASPAPSVSPAPSTSFVPSESLSPSQSLSPTQECGPPIDDYTKMGKGKCLDSNGKTYPMVKYFSGVNSAEECSDKCNCLFDEGFILQGFDFKFLAGDCRCRVDDASLSLGSCASGGNPNVNKEGRGPVISTDGNPNFCCFRNDLTSPAPSVSNAPSTSLAPSVSLAPTRQLKNGKRCDGDGMCKSKCCRPATSGQHVGKDVCVNHKVDARCFTEVPSLSPTLTPRPN